MWTLISVGAYFFTAGLVASALLTDRNINRNKLEAAFCVGAGLLWPIIVIIASGVALFENVRSIRADNQQKCNAHINTFCRCLHKLQLIRKDTLHDLLLRKAL